MQVCWVNKKINVINACFADKAAVTRDAAAELERLRGKKVPESSPNDSGMADS